MSNWEALQNMMMDKRPSIETKKRKRLPDVTKKNEEKPILEKQMPHIVECAVQESVVAAAEAARQPKAVETVESTAFGVDPTSAVITEEKRSEKKKGSSKAAKKRKLTQHLQHKATVFTPSEARSANSTSTGWA